MLVNFNQLPGKAKIWIYQAERPLTESEYNTLNQQLSHFTEQWTSHGQDLKGSFKILYNRFIVLAVDEAVNDASGCAIDSSVHFLQECEKQFGISLLDKSRMAFKQNGSIQTYSLKEFKEALSKGEISKDTLYYNNLAQKADELESNWEIPVKNSWLIKYL